MAGMDAITGKRLDGVEHIRQSVVDILSTPLVSQLHEWDYGSNIARSVDSPVTADYVSWLAHAAAMCLRKWENRWRVTRVTVPPSLGGKVRLTLDGVLTATGERYVISGVEVGS